MKTCTTYLSNFILGTAETAHVSVKADFYLNQRFMHARVKGTVGHCNKSVTPSDSTRCHLFHERFFATTECMTVGRNYVKRLCSAAMTADAVDHTYMLYAPGAEAALMKEIEELKSKRAQTEQTRDKLIGHAKQLQNKARNNRNSGKFVSIVLSI